MQLANCNLLQIYTSQTKTELTTFLHTYPSSSSYKENMSQGIAAFEQVCLKKQKTLVTWACLRFGLNKKLNLLRVIIVSLLQQFQVLKLIDESWTSAFMLL